MKSKQLRLIPSITACLAPALAGLSLQSAHAVSGTWSATPTNGNWQAAAGETNWSSGEATFPGDISGGTTNTDSATFSLDSSITAIAINASSPNSQPLNIGSIGFTGNNLATNYTIGTNGGNTLLVTSNTSADSATRQIFISGAGRNAPTAAITETIAAPVILAPQTSTTAGFYTFQNNSTSNSSGDRLVFSGSITGGTTTAGTTLTLRGGNINTNAVNGAIGNGQAALGMSVTKLDGGTWILSGANTYAGNTTVSAGILSITGSSSGNGNIILNGSSTLNLTPSGTVQTASLQFNSFGTNVNIGSGIVDAGGITSNGNSDFRFFNLNGGTLQSSGNIFSSTAAVAIVFNGGTFKSNNAAGVTVFDANNTIEVNAGGATIDTAVGGVTVGNNTVPAAPTPPKLNGNASGAITLRGGNTLTSGITNNGLFTIQNNSTWNMNGVASSVGGISGADGTITNSGAAQSLTTNFATVTHTFGGDIAGGANLSLTKSGSGTQVLSGNNSYAGSTTVSGGTLVVNGNISTSVVTVSTGATIAGTGSLGGAVTVNSGAFVSPGNSTGNLTLGNGLNLDGSYVWELGALSTDGSTPGANFDTITVNAGSVDITGALLQLSLGAFAPSSDEFWQTDQIWEGIVNNTGAGDLTGSFADIDNSAWSSLGSFSTANSDNDVNLVWTAIPEPSSSLSIGVAGILMMLYRRRPARN